VRSGERAFILLLVAASLAVTDAGWLASDAQAQDTWTTPHPGVRRLYRRTGTPNRIHALFVDLCAAGVRVRATASSETRRTPSSFASLVGAEAAVNGDFYNTSTYVPSGFAVGNGMRWHADSRSEGYVAFGRERAVLSPPSVVGGPDWITDAVGGRPHLVRAGAVLSGFTDPSHCGTRNPRTAAGFTEDGNTLILVVVDGRSSVSAGVTCSELAGLMRGLGAHEALNLDGGGSSGMWVAGVGVVNSPSDGSQRVVSNHLAIQANGSGDPMSCNWAIPEVLTLAESFDSPRSTDVDGDGRADLCVRSSAGFRCHLSAAAGDESVITGPALSDDSGWDEPDNWSTIRMGDINGDGLADVCARAGAGVRCWESTGTGFGEAIVGPELSDAVGWGVLRHATSLRLADVDGDGDDDLCSRAGAGFRCHLSDAGAFATAITGPTLSNATGWGDPSNYGTIQMGDIDGDGLDDVCGRADSGMKCWRSTGTGFGDAIDGPAWNDASGFDHVSHWGTIRLIDVDGDGLADLCARTADGFTCHLSMGDAFGAATAAAPLRNDNGWDDYDNYSTIRMADVDGDSRMDVCGRSNSDYRCWLWDGSAHATVVVGPALSDDSNWDEPEYFRTLRLADVTGDGLADLCGRAASGVKCWASMGDAFAEPIDGPALSDSVGWANERYYGTFRLAGPSCFAREEMCNGEDDDCDGVVDEDVCGGGDAGSVPGGVDSGGEIPAGDAGPGGRADAGGRPPADLGMDGGCGCRVVPPRSPTTWGWFVLLGPFVYAVRRAARRRHAVRGARDRVVRTG
jgi:hypothetical protein